MPTITKRPNNSVYTQVLCKNAASISSAELLNGIQSVSFDTEKQITELNKLGKFGTQDRILNSNQTTNLNIDFILDDQKSNDPFFKFTNNGFLSIDKFNFLIKDLAGSTSINGAYLTNYSLQLTAGEPAIGQLQYQADTISYSESGGISLVQSIPASNFGDALNPKRIYLTTTLSEGVDTASFPVQSINVGVPLNRTPVTRVGQRTPQFRYPDPNTNGTIDISITKNQVKEIDLSSLVLEKGNLVIQFNASDDDNFEQYTFSNCSLISVTEGTSLDGNTTIDFNYSFNLKDNNNILNV